MNIKCIIYYRVPKTGSTTLLHIISELSFILKKNNIKFIEIGHDSSFISIEKDIVNIIYNNNLKNDEYIILMSIRKPSTHCLSLYSHGGTRQNNLKITGFQGIIEKYNITSYENYLSKLFNNYIVIYNNRFGNYKYYYYKLENIKNIKNLYILRTEYLVKDLNIILKKYIDNSIELKEIILNNYDINIYLRNNEENKKERYLNEKNIKDLSNKYFREIDNSFELFINEFKK